MRPMKIFSFIPTEIRSCVPTLLSSAVMAALFFGTAPEVQAGIAVAVSNAGSTTAGQTSTNVYLGTFTLTPSGGGASTKYFDSVTVRGSGTIAEDTNLTNVRLYYTTTVAPSQATQFGGAGSFTGTDLAFSHGSYFDTALSTYYLHLYADITGSPAIATTIITSVLNAKYLGSSNFTGPSATTTPGTRIADLTEIIDGAEVNATSMILNITSQPWVYVTTAGKFDVGTRSFRGGDGVTATAMCEIMESPILSLKSAGTAQFSFRGLFDLEISNATQNWDWMVVQVSTEAGGYSDWSTTPMSSWHTQTPVGLGCSGSVYSGLVIGGTTRDGNTTFSSQGETMGPVNLTGYGGQKVKFRMIYAQDGTVASAAWVDQIKVTNLESSLSVTGLVASTITATSNSFTVTARNGDLTTNTGYTGTVTFTSSDGAAGLPSNYTFVPADLGTKIFNVTFNTGGTQSVTASDVGTPAISGSASSVVENPADTFIDGAEAGATYADLSLTTPAWAYDTAAGKFDVGVRSFRAGDGTTTTGMCEIMETPIVKLKTATSQFSFRGLFDLEAFNATNAYDWLVVQISTEDGGYTDWTTAPFNSWHGQVNYATSTPGCSTSIYSGNVIGGSARDGNTTFGANGETMGPLSLAGYEGKKVKVRFIFSQDIVGVASRVWIDQIKFTNTEPYFVLANFPALMTLSSPSPFNLTAKNRNGTTNTSYLGTVQFTSTDGAASLPSNYTFTGGDNGSKLFTATLNSIGNFSITATDTVTSALTVTGNTTVEYADVFNDGGELASTSMDLSPTTPSWTYETAATKYDAGTRSFRAGDGVTTTELCEVMDTPVIKLKSSGTSQFSFRGLFNLEFSGGYNYDWIVIQISTEEGGYTDWTSAPFAAWHTSTIYPSSPIGCPNSIYRGSVIGGASRDGNSVFSTQGETLGPINLTGFSGKRIKLRFIYSQDYAVASNVWIDQIKVTNVESFFDVSGQPAIVNTGTPYNTTITAKHGNRTTNAGYTGTIDITSTDGAASLPADYTYVGGDSGARVFSVTANTPGFQSTIATDLGNSAVSGSGGTSVDNATGGFLDNVENAGAFKYMVNNSGWTVSSVAAAGGTYSYRNSTGTKGCYQMTTPAVKVPAGVTPWIEFKARMDSSWVSGNEWRDFLVVEVATAEANYSDWNSTPLASIHNQNRVFGGLYACNPTGGGKIIATNSASFTTYRTALPASYAGKTVKLRFISGQYPATVNTVYVDDIKVMGTQPFLVVSGYPEPIQELSAGSATIEAVDRNGQRQTANTDSVSLSSSDTGMTNGGPTPLAAGIVTMTNIKFLSGEWYLQANAGSLMGRQYGITVNPPGYGGAAMTKFNVDSIANPFYSGGTSDIRITASTAADATSSNYTGSIRLSSTNGGFSVPNQTSYTHPSLLYTLSNLGSRILSSLTLNGAGSYSVTATERGTAYFGPENIEHALTETDDANNYLTLKDAQSIPSDGQYVRSGYKSWHMTFGATVGHISLSKLLTLVPINIIPSNEGTAYLKFYWKGSGADPGSAGATNFFYVQKSTDSGATWSRLADTANANYNYYPGYWGSEMNACTTSEFEAAAEKLSRGDYYPDTIFGKSFGTWQLATFSLASLQNASTARRVDFRIRFCASGFDSPTPVENMETADGYSIDDVRVEGVDSMVNAPDTWSGSQTVTVAAIGNFLVAGLPSPFESQTSNSITVTARDASNNILSNYTGTVTFDETALGLQPGEALPANYTFTLADQGVHTFTSGVSLVNPGTRTVRVRDNADLGKLGTQSVNVVDTGIQLQLEGVSSPPATVNPGATNIWMGTYKFSLSKLNAAATDLTSIKVTLNGTIPSADIAAVRLSFDTDANFGNGVTGTLGSQTFSGSPATSTFSGISGWSVGSTPKYVHVLFDLVGGATLGATAGAKLVTSGDIVNSLNYSFYGLKAPPVALGDTVVLAPGAKTWSGTTSTWSDTNNWTPAGVPTSSDDVVIVSAAASPVLSGSTVVKSLTIGSGSLTVTNSATLKIQEGNFNHTSTGSFDAGTGTILLSGAAAVQSVASIDDLYNLTIDKSAGVARIGSDVTIENLVTFVTGTLEVGIGNSLTLNSSVTVARTLSLLESSNIKMASGKTITVASGGTLRTNISNATNDLSKYATVTRATTGTYTVQVQSGGTFNAPYSNWRYMDTNGLQILTGATITSGGLNYTFFRNPPNSGTLLRLFVPPPGAAFTGTGFYADGASSVVNIYGNTGSTFTVTTSGGDRNGDAFESQQSGTIMNWTTTPGPATQLVFTTSALNQNTGVCSGAITVTLRDENNNAVNAGSNTTINLSSTSSGGKFYTVAGCGSGLVTSVTLNSGASSVSAYYKDTLAGSPITAAAESPSSGLTDASQTHTITTPSGVPSKLMLLGPAIVATNTCSPVFTAITTDGSGGELLTTINTTIKITAGGRALFYSDSACTASVTTRTITIGNSRATFYYKNTASGSYNICRYRKTSTSLLVLTLGSDPLQICAESDDF